MSFQIGIVGLPNVGKSTLFNAITKSKVEVANYPFTTVSPHVGVVAVKDERVEKVGMLAKSQRILPTTIEFVDIAGLVKGASQGEGLGNQFLSHIREVDAILEVVRFFENKDVSHVQGSVDPKRDIQTLAIELGLADLQTVEKRLTDVSRQAKSGDREINIKKQVLNKYRAALEAEQMASTVHLSDEEKELTRDIQLLTTKPIILVANSKYNLNTKKFEPDTGVILNEVKNLIKDPSAMPQDDIIITIDAQLESELAELADEEKEEYLKELGFEESGLDKIIKTAYKTLNLITFFTAEPKETKAWTCAVGTKAQQAAGKIHTDFERGFVKAEVVQYEKFLEAGSFHQAREKGWLKIEGKDYAVQDGDVMHFRFNL